MFSDFQCPYCRRFSDAVAALWDTDSDGFRIIFKQRPLGMHDWARRAALSSICVSMQSNSAFWALEKFLFTNQDSVSAEDIDTKVKQFAEESHSFDAAKLSTCLQTRAAEAILARDESLADEYHVDATPTFFIDGVRQVGFRDLDGLRQAIRRADSVRLQTDSGREASLVR